MELKFIEVMKWEWLKSFIMEIRIIFSFIIIHDFMYVLVYNSLW